VLLQHNRRAYCALMSSQDQVMARKIKSSFEQAQQDIDQLQE
jgi:hypothetical protein